MLNNDKRVVSTQEFIYHVLRIFTSKYIYVLLTLSFILKITKLFALLLYFNFLLFDRNIIYVEVITRKFCQIYVLHMHISMYDFLSKYSNTHMYE